MTDRLARRLRAVERRVDRLQTVIIGLSRQLEAMPSPAATRLPLRPPGRSASAGLPVRPRAGPDGNLRRG